MVLAIALSFSIGTSLANAGEPRDRLLPVVTHCIADTGVGTTGATAGLCKSPRQDQCGAKESCCSRTTQVWDENADFVAIRDHEMCRCTASTPSNSFIHGLAIPRSKVTGVEDKARPDGIWEFAWKVAAARIQPESEVALFVNPADDRTDDQLHVHITRVRTNSMNAVSSGRPLATLSNTWMVAREMANEKGFRDDYGVLVTKHPTEGFRVLVDRKSPRRYVWNTCP